MRREALVINPSGQISSIHESLMIALASSTPGDRIIMKSVTGALAMYHVGMDMQLTKGLNHVPRTGMAQPNEVHENE